jgi:hypothetical protein
MAASATGRKWLAEASERRSGYRARSDVESLRRSWLHTYPISENDLVKIGRTNCQKTLQALELMDMSAAESTFLWPRASASKRGVPSKRRNRRAYGSASVLSASSSCLNCQRNCDRAAAW